MKMTVNTVEDLDVAGKRALIRVDFNVPLSNGKVVDDSRIVAALPTIRKVLEANGEVVLVSHLGRPKGNPNPAFSLAPVAGRLGELLGVDVPLSPETVGPRTDELVRALTPRRAIMLENLRFHPGETKNEETFSSNLAALGDVYINDAFGSCHRAHASVAGVAKFFSFENKAAGDLLLREIKAFSKLLNGPQHPFSAILGGAKVSDKIGVIKNILGKVDSLLIGGGMAYSFLAAKGVSVGNSLLNDENVALAREILLASRSANVEIVLPVDHVLAKDPAGGGEIRITSGVEIPEGWMALDIGPKTREHFAAVVGASKTVVWNGPLGVFENKAFSQGTFHVAKAVAHSAGFTVVGGGDVVSALKQSGCSDRVGHVSTGGGAFLELLEGKKLPGIECLET